MKKPIVLLPIIFFIIILKSKAQDIAVPKKGIIAIVAMCSSENSDAERKYTQAMAEEVRIQLNKDKTISVLPSSISDNVVVGLVVPGFVSSVDELKKAASKLPSECNVLIMVGPFPNAGGWFTIRIDRPSDLMGLSFNFGPPKIDGDPKSISLGMIRYDIDELLKSK